MQSLIKHNKNNFNIYFMQQDIEKLKNLTRILIKFLEKEINLQESSKDFLQLCGKKETALSSLIKIVSMLSKINDLEQKYKMQQVQKPKDILTKEDEEIIAQLKREFSKY